MTPAYSELVAAVRREGSALLAAAALGREEKVDACPGWTVDDLLEHVGRVYARAALLVSSRATSGDVERPELPAGDRIEVVRELLDDVVEQLGEVSADAPVWNWAEGQPDVAAFWARRMAHESAVHRFDAQRAHGVAEPIDGELAADGIDELIDVIIPRVLARDQVELQEATLVLDGIDDGQWRLRMHPSGVERLDVAAEDATVVSGTTSALLLALYGRVGWQSLQVEGDEGVLEGFTESIAF